MTIYLGEALFEVSKVGSKGCFVMNFVLGGKKQRSPTEGNYLNPDIGSVCT